MLRNLEHGKAVAQRLSVRSKTGVEQSRSVSLIDEPAMYEVIFASTKREAQAFKLWVLKEVLPSIRKHGGYVRGQEVFSEEYIHASIEYLQEINRKALRFYDRETENNHFTQMRSPTQAAKERERAVVDMSDKFGIPLKLADIIASGRHLPSKTDR